MDKKLHVIWEIADVVEVIWNATLLRHVDYFNECKSSLANLAYYQIEPRSLFRTYHNKEWNNASNYVKKLLNLKIKSSSILEFVLYHGLHISHFFDVQRKVIYHFWKQSWLFEFGELIFTAIEEFFRGV